MKPTLIPTARPLAVAMVFALSCWQANPLQAAPNIQNVSPRGLQIGQPTLLTIDGAELNEATQVLLGVPLSSQVVKQSAGNRLQVEVTVAAAANPGIYTLRLANANGISNFVAVGVDALTQTLVTEELDARPVALHGSVTGGQTQRTKFTGRQGERIVIDVESRRLGAQLRPVVRLYDPRGTQIAWSTRRREIGDDARIETTLPHDGLYTIELHDVVYKGANPGFYRMKVGDLRTADFAVPAGVTRGEQARIELHSSNLAGELLTAEFDGSAAQPGVAAVPLPANATLTGGQPRITISEMAEQTEQTENDEPQVLPAAPIAVTGRLSMAKEEDRYQLPVTPGTKLRVELFAERLGAPMDGVLTIRNLQGGQLARGDDQANTADPLIEYTVPANVDQLVIAVKDLVDRGGESFFYRLVVRDAGQPDFSLAIEADRLNVPLGGTQLVRIDAQRRGYDGPIQLAIEDAPDDWQLAGDVIGAGQTIGLLSFSAPSGSPAPAVGRVIGRAAESAGDIVRTAVAPEQPFSRTQPWMRSEIAFGLAPAGPLTIAWTNAGDDDRLTLGGALEASISLNRGETATGKVRVRLLTTQTPLKKKVKQDNKDVEVDDVDRMLRWEAEPTLEPGTAETNAKILVPADLPPGDWGVVLVAELLSADEKNVVYTAATPVRRLPTAESAP